MTNDQAMAKFKSFCENDRKNKRDGTVGSKIDESDEQDWFSLSLGFFAALGLSNIRCHNLAIKARYTHHYWC